jgi:hypothetical protein
MVFVVSFPNLKVAGKECGRKGGDKDANEFFR